MFYLGEGTVEEYDYIDNEMEESIKFIFRGTEDEDVFIIDEDGEKKEICLYIGKSSYYDMDEEGQHGNHIGSCNYTKSVHSDTPFNLIDLMCNKKLKRELARIANESENYTEKFYSFFRHHGNDEDEEKAKAVLVDGFKKFIKEFKRPERGEEKFMLEEDLNSDFLKRKFYFRDIKNNLSSSVELVFEPIPYEEIEKCYNCKYGYVRLSHRLVIKNYDATTKRKKISDDFIEDEDYYLTLVAAYSDNNYRNVNMNGYDTCFSEDEVRLVYKFNCLMEKEIEDKQKRINEKNRLEYEEYIKEFGEFSLDTWVEFLNRGE